MLRMLAALAATTMLVVGACASEGTPGVPADPTATAIEATSSPSPSTIPTVDPEGELCLRVGEIETRLETLRSVELTLPNRTALAVEFDKLQAAYLELERVDLGAREDELEDSMKRLGYRMGEMKLAVEDFQTNPKPRRAASHVEQDSEKTADELNAFVILSRCERA